MPIYQRLLLTMKSTSLSVFFALAMAFCSHVEARTNPYGNLKISSHTYFKGLSDEKITALCDSGTGLGTQDIFFCQKHIFEAAEKELQAQYKRALEVQIKLDNQLPVKAAPALIESQRLWTQYRNRTCDYLYFSAGGGDPSHGGGTGVSLEYIGCMTDMTKQRIQELTESRN